LFSSGVVAFVGGKLLGEDAAAAGGAAAILYGVSEFLAGNTKRPKE
jgi:hypothetical protein